MTANKSKKSTEKLPLNWKNYYSQLTARQKKGFWFLHALNFLSLIIMVVFAGANVFSCVGLFLLTAVLILLWYYYFNGSRAKSKGMEWIDAIAFAVIAASIIRGLFMEAFTIPTGSMENSLLVGDYLFVSKFHYGARMPITPISFPFAHNTMPGGGRTKSYLDWFHMPYYRLPGFSEVKRFDAVVFNWPDDTIPRPVDKKENYIKRCIGLPGENLSIENGLVSINGKLIETPEHSNFEYTIYTNGTPLDPKNLKDKFDIDLYTGPLDTYEEQQMAQEMDMVLLGPNDSAYVYHGYLDAGQIEGIRAINIVTKIDTMYSSAESMSYHGGNYFFNRVAPGSPDFMTSVWIPKAGSSLNLTEKNFPLYEKAIKEHEGNSSLELKDGKIYLEGKQITSYTFKLNYYWMMGDNRHNSMDSRFWGFVPEDHVVGKAVFIWMSWDKFKGGVRWSRLFHTVK